MDTISDFTPFETCKLDIILSWILFHLYMVVEHEKFLCSKVVEGGS
jgi:hypothetical protein